MGAIEPFIGRTRELEELKRFLNKKTASLIAVKGRRRIGKSRLIEEFAKSHTFYEFVGILPSKNTTVQDQRNEFSIQLSQQTDLPEVTADDWSKLFILLANVVSKGRVIILLDEISWMGSLDPNFLAKLKTAWDVHFKKNPKLIMILCSSASVWLEKNILSSSGFLGRISYTLTLDELTLKACNQFLGNHLAAYEKLKILSVTGGVPRYLEEIDTTKPADINIKNLCFTQGAILTREFNNIFSDLFGKERTLYESIVRVLASGDLEYATICQKLGVTQSGYVSEHLNNLILSGFIKRAYIWSLKTGKYSNLSSYRLSDNYLRFFLKYIENKLPAITDNLYQFKSMHSLPGWQSIMALQFENLVLNNRKNIHRYLRIADEDIIAANPYFQRKTTRQPGCQIDYLIQTKFNILYLCKIKFSVNIIGSSIIKEITEKIARFKKPQGYSVLPVLIHANGVSEAVKDCSCFAAMIDFTEFLS